MTKHPITLEAAKALAATWFKSTMGAISELPETDSVAAEKFTEIETDALPPFEKSAKGDPKYTVVVRAADSVNFVLLAVVLTETSGGDDLHNPLLYVVEKKPRQRPSGWGHVQPYGKRNDRGTEKIVPTPDPLKVVGNIAERIRQMSTRPPVVQETTKPVSTPQGVFVFDDPGCIPNTGCQTVLLFIPSMRVDEATAHIVVKAIQEYEQRRGTVASA